MILNNTESSEVENISNMFGTHFSSVFEKDINNSNSYVCNLSAGIEMSDTINIIQFTQEEVKKKLKNLDIYKSVGPDDIHPLLLKNCADILAVPIATLFNHSLHSGNFPDKWKEARVIPLHKTGKKDLITNYRPISILSVLSKLLESLVHTVLYRHLQKYITVDQHGFVAKRSTNTNLVLFTSELKEAVDHNTQVDVIYTDFSKAFDKVNYAILIKKLEAFGISGKLLQWCRSYLNSRISRVAVLVLDYRLSLYLNENVLEFSSGAGKKERTSMTSIAIV
ncbi:unnamed protein product [Parnassius apollo]|uniref:(apollo) hypothetical protein n=1 Tax=Parnassius apollo TaxID=110799 RepID=A0A8S3W616_PARAO|nr:unnamed protein product [Parnassius apollo]